MRYKNDDQTSPFSTKYPTTFTDPVTKIRYTSIPFPDKIENVVFKTILKFTQNRTLLKELIKYKSFTNVSSDPYWKDKLGKILTCLRNLLISEKRPKIVQLTPKFIIPPFSGKFSDWEGNIQNNLLSMIYLLNKYPNSCTIVGRSLDNISFGIWWMCIADERALLTPDNFDEDFKKCYGKANVRFIFIPLVLRHKERCIYRDVRKYDDHSNFLIYDKKNKSIERFEPHGKQEYFESKFLDMALIDLFVNSGKYNVDKYLSPLDICPEMGPQVLENLQAQGLGYVVNGYCTAWAFWYGDLRLSNPDMDQRVLIERAIDHFMSSGRNFIEFIIDYSQWLVELGKEVKIPAGLDEDEKNEYLLGILVQLLS